MGILRTDQTGIRCRLGTEGRGAMTDSEMPPVFGIARRERIMDQLRTGGAVRVADLAREFGCPS